MKVEQYVMAYSAEHDRLRAILPDGFTSLRPVLRINAEIRDEKTGYMEFNTAVEKSGLKGWLNIVQLYGVPFEKEGKTTVFKPDILNISFTRTGTQGSCPAEKDNDGCYFIEKTPQLRTPENISGLKEFCNCSFQWHFGEGSAHGVSIGKTLPAVPTEAKIIYPRQEFNAKNAALIPCVQVLGSYVVKFVRPIG